MVAPHSTLSAAPPHSSSNPRHFNDSSFLVPLPLLVFIAAQSVACGVTCADRRRHRDRPPCASHRGDPAGSDGRRSSGSCRCARLIRLDLALTFDPNVVEVVDADPNQAGVQAALGTFLDSGFVVLNAADNVTGTLRFAMTQLNPSQPKSGTWHADCHSLARQTSEWRQHRSRSPMSNWRSAMGAACRPT